MDNPFKFELSAALKNYIDIRDTLTEQLKDGSLTVPAEILHIRDLLAKAEEMIKSYSRVLDNMDLYNTDVVEDSNTYSKEGNSFSVVNCSTSSYSG